MTIKYARARFRRWPNFCPTYARPYVAGGPAPVVRAAVVGKS
jgi:hypothetical protein